MNDLAVAGQPSVVRPVCFMVMPFRRKDTHASAPAPSSVDFDALWEKAFKPALTALGYDPVRADQDLGALIIKEMLERLYFSDLVVADLTIPNGNVYYEIGIRHAAQNVGCVLMGADWARPLFDVDQMRQLRYPLPDGDITDDTAAAVRAAIRDHVPALAAGASPMFQTLEGYPMGVDRSRADVIRRYVQQFSDFEAAVQEVALAPKDQRPAQALALAERYASAPPIVTAVALEVLKVLRDFTTPADTLAFIDGLPESIATLQWVQEQRMLLVSQSGDHRKALAALLELVKTHGETSERMGLIGGRYRRLSAAETDPTEQRRLLNKAIDAYERGMRADLNDYYPSCNLPRLYRQRHNSGDDDRARSAAAVAMTACLRAKERNPSDEWLRPTLLGMAFDAGNVATAETLAEEIVTEGAVAWKLQATLDSLKVSLALHGDPATRDGLQRVFDDLARLV